MIYSAIQRTLSLHFNFDPEDTLLQQDVSHGMVNKVANGLTRVNHEPISKLHGLGTGSTKLAGYDNFATLGA